MSSSDFLWGIALGGLGGYATGKGPFQEWESFINNVNQRLNHLAYFKPIIPESLFAKLSESRKWYSEGSRAFLFGLPNASIPMLFKCLELGITKKYEEVESKKPSLSSSELIDWAEKYLKDNKELAHGFRIIRNLLHNDKSVEEQETIQAIFNISKMINLLFPYENRSIISGCPNCKTQNNHLIMSEQNFIGNNLLLSCSKCQTAYNLRILI